MFKNLIYSILFILSFSTLSSCSKDEVAIMEDVIITTLRFQEEKISLEIGEELQLNPIYSPRDAKTKYEWSSSDKRKATVIDGRVTAKNSGECIISVIEKYSGLKANLTVQVKWDDTVHVKD